MSIKDTNQALNLPPTNEEWEFHLNKMMAGGRRKRKPNPLRPSGSETPKDGQDAINPSHYRSHPSGVEAIQITEHLNFCIGNAMKYLWRAGLKGDAVEDLKKSIWYIEREIARIGGGQ